MAKKEPTPPQAHKYLVFAFLAALCIILLLQLKDLAVSDLPRHLKNGDVILHGTPADRDAVLHTNFYSYAARDYPFINHHWLSGVVFYLFWRMFDFEGLTIFYAILVAAAVLIFYWVGARASSMMIAVPVAALAIPIIAGRTEVRPEGFTYLFAAIVYLILSEWTAGRLVDKWLYAIPLMMTLWVNLHIGFIFGFLIIGAFWLERMTSKPLIIAFGLSIAGALLNPSFVKGALYPFNIYRHYEFDVAENHSILRMPPGWEEQFLLYKLLMALVAAAIMVRWLFAPQRSGWRWPQLLLLVTAGGLAISTVRQFPMFALLSIAILPSLLNEVASATRAGLVRAVAVAISLVAVFNWWQQFESKSSRFGIGLRPNVNATAEFLSTNHIAGPIFNDFNNGGYLVFHRLPAQNASIADRVFVDARAEAYPAGFFENLKKMQADENAWHEADQKYHFNAIVFSLQFNNDPETERFMLARVHDPEWAPVFTDDYSLVYVRRNGQNSAVIKAHELPQSMFR